MRQRIVAILGVVVALLAVYTVFFRARPGGRWTSADVGAAAERIRASAASQATGAAADVEDEEGVVAGDSAAAEAAKPKGTGGPSDKPAEPRQPETWGTDPFVRDWVMVNELAELNLNAITIGGERAYALINDQILEVGDNISGKRIVSIDADKVVLEQGGRTFNLLLGE